MLSYAIMQLFQGGTENLKAKSENPQQKGSKKMEDFSRALQTGLKALIQGEADPEEICWENINVNATDKGLILTLPDGSEYRLSIVRSH